MKQCANKACEQEFEPSYKHRTYCSHECQQEATRKKMRRYFREYRAEHPDKMKEYREKSRERCLKNARKSNTKLRSKRREDYVKLRHDAYAKVGVIRCTRHQRYWGYELTDERVLQIHHINGNGAEQRRKFGVGATFFNHILNGDIPVDELELICANCHALEHSIDFKIGAESDKQ